MTAVVFTVCSGWQIFSKNEIAEIGSSPTAVGRFVWEISVAQFVWPNLPFVGLGKRGLLEKGSFQKSPFSRDSRDF